MDEVILAIQNCIIAGDRLALGKAVEEALGKEVPASIIVEDGFVEAMDEVGQLYERKEYFIPEMMVSANAMNTGLEIIRPFLIEQDVPCRGKVLMGTVLGDLHDLGKSLVSMMLTGAGFTIIDAGINVSPEAFARAIDQHKPDVVGMSAMLATTMLNMGKVIDTLVEYKMRNSLGVIVGGAPITAEFADRIGADGYADDAVQAVHLVQRLIEQ